VCSSVRTECSHQAAPDVAVSMHGGNDAALAV
jgi:hypothetical protein